MGERHVLSDTCTPVALGILSNGFLHTVSLCWCICCEDAVCLKAGFLAVTLFPRLNGCFTACFTQQCRVSNLTVVIATPPRSL